VVLVPAGICADWFETLMEEPAVTDRYRVLNYHRIGYAGNSSLAGPVSIQEQAAHCRSLMNYLGIYRGHIVGHSSGAMIALQLALDAPDMVQTLALMESARPAESSEIETEFVRAVAQPTLQRYAAGDKSGAADTWMREVCGPDYRAVLEQAIPGAFDQAVANADTFLDQELPAVREWSFTREDASRITQPVLAVLGAKTGEVAATFGERRELLLSGCHTSNPLTSPTQLICFTCRILARWSKLWLPSSPVIRSRHLREQYAEQIVHLVKTKELPPPRPARL
jgi:pimeloyl-ACP methyl ester carboxylesterase